MDFLYDWIKNVAVYMLLVSVVVNLLPRNHYEKYVRLFTGMVMIILLIKPVSTFFHLSDKLDTIFSLDVYKQELGEWEIDFRELNSSYEKRVMEGYKEQLRTQLKLILSEEGCTLSDVEFELCLEQDSDCYGQLSYMKIYLSDKNTSGIESPFSREYKNLETTRIKEKICEYYQLEKEQVTIYGA